MYIQNTRFQKGVSLLITFDFVIFFVRSAYARNLNFSFLFWNLFLAILPFIFSELALLSHGRNRWWSTGFYLLLCLLFLPNAPYMITDLFHLNTGWSSLVWIDSLLLFSFTLSGFLFFYPSLFNLEKILTAYVGKKRTMFMLIIIIFLSAFGIYLGRYLRFNSWDVFTSSSNLYLEIFSLLVSPFTHQRTWSFTLVYGLFFLISYYLLKLCFEQNNE